MQLILRRKQKLSSFIALCVVVAVVLVCVRLGYWQLARAEQKQQQLTAIANMQTQGVMSWQQLQAMPSKWNKTGVEVELVGKIINQQYWLLDNQVYQGQVGYDLLVLFKPSQASGVLLVNLGWVKAPISRSELPNIQLPKSTLTFKAQIKEQNLASFNLQTNSTKQDFQKRIQSIDLQKLSKQSNQSLFNFMAYRQGTGDALAIPHYTAVVMSPQKHQAYAVQWFLIALACVVVAIFASKKRTNNEK
ncbi:MULTISPECIES: SURF1 family protein [Pseudoalteromonas]|uniref:SURF1 family protein n=1 Tax=Pseudoalteromonas undina TaxID=43660 RepID=A0ACC6R668_9GAMM|nr:MULTISPECIES: SURF1 family protein [unclassified Pseudoalteromonas]KPZ54968.1 SURF1 family protein [Pseudoalteromonas sp. P1-25]KPZ56469.1 SURF1 family protein [Pseudoalteromonas sp. P1-13-1a]